MFIFGCLSLHTGNNKELTPKFLEPIYGWLDDNYECFWLLRNWSNS